MEDAVQIIDQELAALQARRDECQREVARFQRQLEALNIEVGTLQRVRKAIDGQTATPPSLAGSDGAPPSERPTPSEAVLAFIRKHPNLNHKTVIDGVASQELSTTSTNVRRLLDSTIRYLLRVNKLSERGGGLFIEEDEE